MVLASRKAGYGSIIFHGGHPDRCATSGPSPRWRDFGPGILLLIIGVLGLAFPPSAYTERGGVGSAERWSAVAGLVNTTPAKQAVGQG